MEEPGPEETRQWREICAHVSSAMREHAMHCVTPISRAISHEYGELQGTGAYIEYEGARLLITNEHVVRQANGLPLTHQLQGCTDVFKLADPVAMEGHPLDLAMFRIGEHVWESRPHTSSAVPVSLFSQEHKPVERESLFFYGYAGERSKFHFEHLFTTGTPLLTQEPIPPVTGLHSNYFTLSYKPELAESVDGSTRPLPVPHGFSGSLVWNTRVVELLAKNQMPTLSDARVTGILCSWPSANSCVVAVRAEVILDFLQRHIGVAGTAHSGHTRDL